MLLLQTCDSGPAAPPDPGLMDIDTDMEFPQHLGIDNDALDINDINFMDENILKSKTWHEHQGSQ